MPKQFGTPGPRVMKPEIATDPALARCSIGAQLLFSRLVVMADDQGRQIGDADVLKAACFPRVPAATIELVEEWLAELADRKLVVRYVADDEPLIQLTGWWKHQDTQRRAYPSRWPTPEGWDDCVRLEVGRGRVAAANDGFIAAANGPAVPTIVEQSAADGRATVEALDESGGVSRPNAADGGETPRLAPDVAPLPVPMPMPVPYSSFADAQDGADFAAPSAWHPPDTKAWTRREWLTYVVEPQPVDADGKPVPGLGRPGRNGKSMGWSNESIARLGDFWTAQFGTAPPPGSGARLAKLRAEHPGGVSGLLQDISMAAMTGAVGDPLDYISRSITRRNGNGGQGTPGKAARTATGELLNDYDSYAIRG